MKPENDWKQRLGVVYSTDPGFNYVKEETSEEKTSEEKTLEPSRQRLIVTIDRKGRGGKQVTLVSGFVGTEEDLVDLGRTLKVKCGVGGTAKDGLITVQGDLRERSHLFLRRWVTTRRGGTDGHFRQSCLLRPCRFLYPSFPAESKKFDKDHAVPCRLRHEMEGKP